MLTNPQILQAALEGLEAKLARVDTMIAAIKAKAPAKAKKKTASEGIATKKPRRKRRELSPDARQRMAEAQKKRWAAVRKAKG